MVTSYPLPEGFSEFDVFSLGSCLLVEGKSHVQVKKKKKKVRVSYFVDMHSSSIGCALSRNDSKTVEKQTRI